MTSKTMSESIRETLIEHECFPSFEELKEVEWIRLAYTFDFVSEMGSVIAKLSRLKLYRGLSWILRCRSNERYWGQRYDELKSSYIIKYGPVESWFDEQFRAKVYDG